MRLWILALALLVTGCEVFDSYEEPEAPSPLEVPFGFPPVPVPSHNPITAEKVALGEKLFFDPILSRDESIACSSCHLPDLAFADPRSVSLGVDARAGLRNSPTLVNIAYQNLFFWDGGALTLENQILGPLQDPNEMDAHLDTVLLRLRADTAYVRAFDQAFGLAPDITTMTQAIASFERTIRSGGSRYDAYLSGDDQALTQEEKRGLALFEGRAQCSTCHSGFLLTNLSFENNGLAFANADSGRARITTLPDDFGKFKVPSLRNLGLTAPYMHDGRISTIEMVIEHYNQGGTGSRGQHDSIKPLDLTSQEKADLLAFLNSLSDTSIYIGLDNL